MQLFSTLLAVAASVFVMVSAEEHQQVAGSPKTSGSPKTKTHGSRGSRKLPNPEPIIGGDSSVWGPSISRSSRSSRCSRSSSSTKCPSSSSSTKCPSVPSCPSRSSRSSRCSSRSRSIPSCPSSSSTSCPSSSSSSCVSSSSSCWSPCDRPDYGCGVQCNPFGPAVTPLNPITPCDPLYGPGYGAYPGGCADVCASPCASPCGPRPYGNVGRAQPWYVYLTATLTSTYSSIATTNTFTTTDLATVSYTIFTIASADVPTAYYTVFASG